MQNTYKGRGLIEDYDNLMAMLNNVFFLEDEEEPRRDFLSLLPKLYKKEYDPCHANLIVKEDGKIKGAVGLFPVEWKTVAGNIRVGGIGNVAVARDCRREGHMKECLNMAIEESIRLGDDIMMLGGDRHRYGYFGFEPMGLEYSVRIRKRDLIHKGIPFENNCECIPLTSESREAIEGIKAIHNSLPFTPVRSDEKFCDIMHSWHCTPYYVTEDGRFIGYFTVNRNGHSIADFRPADCNDWYKLALCVFEIIDEDAFNVRVPEFDRELLNILIPVFGDIDYGHSEMFNILNYEKILRAFMSIKATYAPLCDGSVIMLIHGYRCDEKIKITVKDNNISVESTDSKPDFEFEHREAERIFGSLESESRYKLPANIAQWFPLPLFSYPADGV